MLLLIILGILLVLQLLYIIGFIIVDKVLTYIDIIKYNMKRRKESTQWQNLHQCIITQAKKKRS